MIRAPGIKPDVPIGTDSTQEKADQASCFYYGHSSHRIIYDRVRKNEESSINLVVSSIGVDNAALGKMFMEQGEGFTVQGQRISFTPSSVRVNMESLVVFVKWVRNQDNEIVGGEREIGIPINRTVDLVGSGSISDLITESIAV